MLISYADSHLINLLCAANDFEGAQRLAEELLQSGCEKKHGSTISRALQALATIAIRQQDYVRGRDYLEQVLARILPTETLGHINVLRALGRVTARLEEYAVARDYMAQSIAICQEAEDLGHEGWAYYELASIAHRQDNKAESLEWMQKAMRTFEMGGETWSICVCLRVMAQRSEIAPEQAAVLWGMFDRMAQESSHVLTANQQAERDAACAALQTELTEPVFAAIEERCNRMSWQEVVRDIQ